MANQNCLSLTVNAGNHDRDGCPVVVNIDHPGIHEYAKRNVILTEVESNEVISAQCYKSDDKKSTTVAWILNNLPAGASRTYMLSQGDVNTTTGVKLEDDTETIDVTLNSRPFTTFRYGKSQFRPYFFPVLGAERT